MKVFSDFKIYILIYLVSTVIYNEFYKIVTKSMKKAGALTVIIQLIAGIFSLLLIPLFEFRFSNDYKICILLGLSIIFYAIQDRLSTTARSKIEASTYGIIKQISTVFMIILGFIFFKEELLLNKIIGSILIIFSNILVFYRKGTKIDKNVFIGILANIFLSIVLFLDVNSSNQFNVPLYVSITLIGTAILICIFDKVKIKDIVREYKDNHFIVIVSICWSLMMISKLMAYKLEKVTIVAPLCSLSVILNVLISYLFFNEKNNLLRKVIASMMILIGIILIKT